MGFRATVELVFGRNRCHLFGLVGALDRSPRSLCWLPDLAPGTWAVALGGVLRMRTRVYSEGATSHLLRVRSCMPLGLHVRDHLPLLPLGGRHDTASWVVYSGGTTPAPRGRTSWRCAVRFRGEVGCRHVLSERPCLMEFGGQNRRFGYDQRLDLATSRGRECARRYEGRSALHRPRSLGEACASGFWRSVGPEVPRVSDMCAGEPGTHPQASTSIQSPGCHDERKVCRACMIVGQVTMFFLSMTLPFTACTMP